MTPLPPSQQQNNRPPDTKNVSLRFHCMQLMGELWDSWMVENLKLTSSHRMNSPFAVPDSSRCPSGVHTTSLIGELACRFRRLMANRVQKLTAGELSKHGGTICKKTHTHTHAHICTQTYTCACKPSHTHTHAHICTHIYTCACKYSHTHTHHSWCNTHKDRQTLAAQVHVVVFIVFSFFWGCIDTHTHTHTSFRYS